MRTLPTKITKPNFSSKAYWSILKNFLIIKKVLCIPPIFHESRFTTDFKGKDELFNYFFANECSLITNGSVLPSDYELFMNESLSKITITDKDIERIVRGLDSTKLMVIT